MSTFFWLLVKLFDKRMVSIFRTPGGTEDIENDCILVFCVCVWNVEKLRFVFIKLSYIFFSLHLGISKINVFIKYIIYNIYTYSLNHKS